MLVTTSKAFIIFNIALVSLLIHWASSSSSENSKLSWPRLRYRNFENFLDEKTRHVCLTEHVNGGSRRQYSSECMNAIPARICGKKTYIRYHCCAGYQLEHPISEGCYLVKPTVNLEGTMNSFYLVDMEKHLNNLKNKNLLTQSNSTLTIFVPQNHAFKNLSQQTRNQLRSNSEPNLLLLHMANNRLTSEQMHNNKNITTLYGQDLHIHRYASGIITVNCVRIVRPNLLATNGIIHVVEDVIKPIENNANLMESLNRRQDAILFVSALKSTGVDRQLADLSNHHTVVLPTDAAILKLGKKWDRIKNSPELLKKFVLYHIIDCCICASSVLGAYFPRTLEGDKMRIDCGVDDRVSFDDVIATEVDHVTTNGIIHTIDEALIPTSVMTVKDKLEDLGHHSIFLNFSNQSGLADALDGRQGSNFITVFTPFDDTFEKANKTEDSQWLNGDREIRKMMTNYVVAGDFSTPKLIGLKSLEAGLRPPTSQVAVNMHDNVFYINNAKIVKPDIRVANGIIHVIDFLLLPKIDKIRARIEDASDLKIFTSLLKSTTLGDARGGMQRTIFAPIDDAFKNFRPTDLEKLYANKTAINELIRRHTLPLAVYPVSLRPSLINRFKSLNNEPLTIINKVATATAATATGGVARKENLEINKSAKVIRHLANNVDGVLYVVDRLL